MLLIYLLLCVCVCVCVKEREYQLVLTPVPQWGTFLILFIAFNHRALHKSQYHMMGSSEACRNVGKGGGA